jgi:hypothetical protein
MGILGFLKNWAGGVVMAAAFAIGIPDSITATKELVSWVSPWGTQPIHVAFWLLLIGSVYTTITQGIRVKRSENRLPDINVKSEIHDDRVTLTVENTGGEADFTAKARVTATMPEQELYTMCWDSIQGPQCHIDGDGGIASILVGEKARYDNHTRDIAAFFMKGGLVLFKRGATGEQIFPVFSGGTSKEVIDGEEWTKGSALDRCIVEITITATPRLKKKWGMHKYLCEIEHGEIRFLETELSNPHKVDY